MNFPQVKESSELSRLKAFADNDLDSTCGFVQGGTDEFSKNNTDQENNTITFSLYNPTTSPLDVQLYGFDPANFTTVPANPPPSVISASIPLLAFPQANVDSISTPNNTIYISNQGTDTIQVIDCFTNTVILTLALPLGFGPNSTAYCPVNNQMYVGSGLTNQAIRIDCNTNTIIGPPIITTIGFSSSVGGLIYNSVKNSMYSVDTLQQNIIEISCFTNLQVSYILGAVQLEAVAFNPIFNRLYINNAFTTNVDVLDCATNTFLPSIVLPISPSAGSIVFCSSNNSIYVSSSVTDDIVRIDCSTSLVVGAPIPLGVVTAFGLGYNPINNVIYAAGQVSDDYVVFDVVTNIVSAPSPLGLGNTFTIFYNQNNNSVYFIRQLSNNAVVLSPLFAPTVTINLPGGVTPAMIYNDTQTKPFLIRGVRIITDNFSQWSNNITFSNNSYTGAKDSKQWQPLNYISPTSRNSTIVDAPDFVLDVDRGPDSTALDFKIEPLTNVILLFTVGKSLDSSTIFCQQDKEHVDNTTAIRYTGNPIADIFLSKMTKEEIVEQESKYSSVEYANYPRETGNPIADIALLRNYGIQGI